MKKKIYKILDKANFKNAVICVGMTLLGWTVGVGMSYESKMKLSMDNIYIWLPFIGLCIVSTIIGFWGMNEKQHIETDEEFEERLRKIRSKDGNHMLLITAMIEERKKLKEKELNEK